MKNLPVIQPTAAQAPTPSDLKTAGMVNDPVRAAEIEPKVRAAVSTVFDPEIPVNVYDLGLIYEILVTADAEVGVRMTLTAPACPAAQWLPAQVEQKAASVEGVARAVVDVVFDPPWTKDRMSDAAKLQLGLW